MADVKLVGVQLPAAPRETALPIGALVSGVRDSHAVIALRAHDEDGAYYIVLNGADGQFEIVGDGQLLHAQEVPAELLIEPAEGITPFALPQAGPTGSAIVLTANGDVGLRLTIPRGDGRNWIVMNSLKTGEPIPTGSRLLLTGFKLLLKIEGREEPLPVGTF